MLRIVAGERPSACFFATWRDPTGSAVTVYSNSRAWRTCRARSLSSPVLMDSCVCVSGWTVASGPKRSAMQISRHDAGLSRLGAPTGSAGAAIDSIARVPYNGGAEARGDDHRVRVLADGARGPGGPRGDHRARAARRGARLRLGVRHRPHAHPGRRHGGLPLLGHGRLPARAGRAVARVPHGGDVPRDRHPADPRGHERPRDPVPEPRVHGAGARHRGLSLGRARDPRGGHRLVAGGVRGPRRALRGSRRPHRRGAPAHAGDLDPAARHVRGPLLAGPRGRGRAAASGPAASHPDLDRRPQRRRAPARRGGRRRLAPARAPSARHAPPRRAGARAGRLRELAAAAGRDPAEIVIAFKAPVRVPGRRGARPRAAHRLARPDRRGPPGLRGGGARHFVLDFSVPTPPR